MERPSTITTLDSDPTIPFSKSKFFHSLRNLKVQFRQIYKRCKCSCDRTNSGNVAPHNREQAQAHCLNTAFSKAAGEAREVIGTGVEQADVLFIDSTGEDSSVKYSTDELSFWIQKWEAAVGLNWILPTPPPTPVTTLGSSRPDGDFLFKVIPPPYDFQDSAFISRPASSSSAAVAAAVSRMYQQRHRNRRNICSLQLSQATSDVSVHSRKHYKNPSGHLLSGPSFHYSTYSKLLTTSHHPLNSGLTTKGQRQPKSKFRCNANSGGNKVKLHRGKNSGVSKTCSSQSQIMDSRDLKDTPTKAKNTFSSNNNHESRNWHPRECNNESSNIVWKDLPKSISLNINNGLVEAMFIPTWSDQSLRKAPFFPKLKHVINWSAITIRNERTEVKKNKLRELERNKTVFTKNVWNLRRQVGWMKRHLLEERRIANIEIIGDISGRFQFIHWLNENTNNVNTVGRFFDIEDKRIVAIKTIPEKGSTAVCDQLRLKMGSLREIRALIRLDHVNVVQIFTYFEHLNKIHIVLEACDHSLRCELSCTTTGVDPKMAHGVIYQIILGLEHVHRRFYLHRNLCPDNILVTVEGIVKIGDFSRSVYLKGFGRSKSISPGTIVYGAPELLALDSNYDEGADVWSVGCILVELLRGKVIWDGSTCEEQLLLIHKTVGPLLRQHGEVAMIKYDGEQPVHCLHEYLPEQLGDAQAFIEKCFEVDPAKRMSCKGLLEHVYIKQGTSCQGCPVVLGENALPRFALWDRRPHTAPLLTFSSKGSSTNPHSNSDDKPKEMKQTTKENENNCLSQNQSTDTCEGTSRLTSEPVRTKTVVMKPKASVVFSSELVTDGKLARPKKPPPVHSYVADFSKGMEPFSEMDYRGLLHCLNEISTPKVLSNQLYDFSPILRKGSEARKASLEGRRTFENLVNSGGDLARPTIPENIVCSEPGSVKHEQLPSGPRSRIQYIINILPQATWNTVQLFTSYLNQSAKKNPKTFCNHLTPLITTLLDQIADAKSKVAGPAIRILSNICESKGELFEPEAERIIESMLNKLGGPSFIEKEGNEVLKHLVNSLKPTKAILSLIKFGANHKTAAARQTTIILVLDALKKLDLIPAFGLPGEQTAAQRRLSNAVFDISTRSLRDSNTQTRLAARDIYQLLMSHPGFWYLYQSTIPEEKRQWVNRLLEEIRRFHTIEKKSIGRKSPGHTMPGASAAMSKLATLL